MLRPIAVHENRTVLVSIGRSGALRVHRGYAYGPDRTLQAIVDFAAAKNHAGRSRAEREILSFQVDRYVRPKRSRHGKGVRRRDRRVLTKLGHEHRQLNAQFFNGELSPVPFRVSGRMRTRLGEVTVHPDKHSLVEMTISRLHVERDCWDEVRVTLVHEMIHQWQAENGFAVDHGVIFRNKAREIGVAPSATRRIGNTKVATERFNQQNMVV